MMTQTFSRNLHPASTLKRLLAPQSVAIVGASEKEAAFSSRTLENLAGYQGRIHLVNPKYERLGERVCHASLRALPEVPDCVVIAVPWQAVVNEVRAAADAGAGGAIVYASGFAETGLPERIALQDEIARIAHTSGMRVLGPNCLGIANNALGAGLLFQMGYASLPRGRGRVGLVSQSGALGYAILQGAMHGLSYSHLLTAGNSCDVDTLDLVNYLIEDESCQSIACIFEAAGDAQRLMMLAERAWERGKPVIIYKTAVGEVAAAAAQSHTGSLAGSSQAFDAALRRGRLIAANSLAELTEMADFFAKAPPPKATGVAVMATSGGAAIMCADAASNHDVLLPQPAPATQEILNAVVPEFGSARNPCDITGQVLNSPQDFEACARAMLVDPLYGALVLPQVTAGQKMADHRCPVVSELARTAQKPVCVVWLSDWQEGPGAATYAADERIGFFRDTERCFRTLALWQAWHEARRTPVTFSAEAQTPNADQERLKHARALLDASGQQVVTESPAKKLLALYGLPVVAEQVAESLEQLDRLSNGLGYPLVLKMDVPGVAHKSELGLVQVGLKDAGALRDAARQMWDSLPAAGLQQTGARFLIQPMVRSHLELMLGMKRDPVFGPLIMVGLGGIWVEIISDVAKELAPVDQRTAARMIAGLKTYRLLEGYRGKPGVNLDELAALVVDFSRMCTELADDIEEIDINPVLATQQGLVAVDALLIRRQDLA